MDHRHLNHDELTLAAIDSLIERGAAWDWLRLARAIRESDEVLSRVRRLCEARLSRSDPAFYTIEDYRYWQRFVDLPEDEAAVAAAHRRCHHAEERPGTTSDETRKEAIARIKLRWVRRLAALQRPSTDECIREIFNARGKWPEDRPRPIAGAELEERQDTKLDLLMDLWDVSGEEARQIYGSAPDEAALEALEQTNDLLQLNVPSDRIAAVVRQPAQMLDGQSLLDLATYGRQTEVLAAVQRMFK